MILGAPVLKSPFDEPDLHWCEARFAVVEHRFLDHGGFRVDLPVDLSSAVPKRRSEFLAGRFCAAMALKAAGYPQVVGRNGRAPVWPDGVAGSITHSRDRAIAAVSTRFRGLGIDCEPLVPHDRATALCSVIFTEAEAGLRPAALPFATFFTLVFSGKEALYKAMSARLARIPDFLDVTLTRIGPEGLDLMLDGQTHRARFRLSAQDCLTLVSV